MASHNISYIAIWIVGAFLLITLILGLYAGRGNKSIKEYALGNGRFSTGAIVLTFLATNIGGGSIIGMTKSTYKIGIIATIACLALPIQYLLFAFIIAPKIKSFKNCLTIGDLAEQLYGKYFKFLTGILTFIYIALKGSIQLMAVGEICESLLNINSSYIIILVGIILAIYSAYGGIKSVTATDIFHFIIIIITFPLISTLLLNKIGSYKTLFTSLPTSHLTIFKNKEFHYYLTLFLIWGIIPISLLSPSDMQRIFMTSNENQAKNQYLISSFLDPIFRIIIMIIGLSTLLIFPNIEPQNIFPKLINDLIKSPLLKGLSIIGIMSVILSTADSLIHSASLVFSHDILSPIFKKKNKEFNELSTARISTIIMVLISIYIAINAENLIDLSLYGAKFAGPTLLFPLLIGILGLKPDRKSLIFSIISGVSIFLIFDLYLPIKMQSLAIPFGIIINGLVYMLSHLIQNKGLSWIKRDKEEEEEKLWIPNPQKIFNDIISFIPTPKKIYNYSKFQVMKNGSQNILFGIYACINFTLPYFLWDHQDQDKYNLMINLRLIGGVMAGLLIVKDQWKEFLKPFYPLYWHITLTYCLPFITTIMFLLTGGSTAWLLNVGTSIFFLIMLVTGELFLILAPLGIGLGIAFYKFYVGSINLSSLGFDINYYLVYQLVFSTVIGLLFAFRKRIFNIIRGNIGLNLGSALCHEIRNTLYSLTCNQYNRMRMEEIEEHGTKKIEGQEGYFIKKKLFDSFLEQTNQAISFDIDTIKVIKTFEKIFKEYKKSISNPDVCSTKSVIEYTLKELHFLPGQKEKIKLNVTDDFYVKLPKSAFAFVISNIIRNAFIHGRASEVEIKLENHQLKIRDNGIGIPPSKLEKIFKMYYTTEKDHSTGIGLGFAKLIAESIYGSIWCESEQGENSYSEFIIQFPGVAPSEITNENLIEIKTESEITGQRKEKEKMALKMLKEGESIKKIEEYTELKKSEIQEIRKFFDS